MAVLVLACSHNSDAASQPTQPARQVAVEEQPELPKRTQKSKAATTSHMHSGDTRKGTADQRAEHSKNESANEQTTTYAAAAGLHMQQRSLTHHSRVFVVTHITALPELRMSGQSNGDIARAPVAQHKAGLRKCVSINFKWRSEEENNG